MLYISSVSLTIMLILMSISDIQTKQLPISLLFLFTPVYLAYSDIGIVQSIQGALVLFVIFFPLAYSGSIGGGDLILLTCLGMYLGVLPTLWICLWASISFMAYHLVEWLDKGSAKERSLPFAPFLLFGWLLLHIL